MTLDDRDIAIRRIAAHNREQQRYALIPEPRPRPSIFRRVVMALRSFLSLDPWRSDR